MTSKLDALTAVPSVVRITPDLESAARGRAAASGVPFEDHHCETNSYFALLAALDLGHRDVCLVAGYRVADLADWSRDPHVWLYIEGQHIETSPGNAPVGKRYMEAWRLVPGPDLDRTMQRQYQTIVTDLAGWPSER
ncbi:MULTISPECIES: hypothetical protein [Myxococcus]|uniref:hypothetical protein n=1 Tax=Myxococcus TaxID=32 RepID=UPI001141CE20|nr:MULTISPECIES: hypothetical protein [Myxococcus]NOK05819.1 hypothetical protein [Myxococcus xanthus]